MRILGINFFKTLIIRISAWKTERRLKEFLTPETKPSDYPEHWRLSKSFIKHKPRLPDERLNAHVLYYF